LFTRYKTHEAKEFADAVGIDYIETSALENINVEEAFTRLALKVVYVKQTPYDCIMTLQTGKGLNVKIKN
jgi:hypothetical protein